MCRHQISPLIGEDQISPFIGLVKITPFIGRDQISPLMCRDQISPLMYRDQLSHCRNPQTSWISSETSTLVCQLSSSPFSAVAGQPPWRRKSNRCLWGNMETPSWWYLWTCICLLADRSAWPWRTWSFLGRRSVGQTGQTFVWRNPEPLNVLQISNKSWNQQPWCPPFPSPWRNLKGKKWTWLAASLTPR